MSPPNSARGALSGRRGIALAVVAGCAGLLGAALARPLVNAFRGASPWILPSLVVGALTILVVGALLLPLFRARRP
ncbi:MAG TPA: hypothetical protein VMU67_17470 [Steroidobacteraceae bacterium]|nr:hypothetical protein [Steroidobacteraceae bacterium]